MNRLIKGDNINGLQWLLDNGYEKKIDLIYIDPPFATGVDFAIGEDRVSTISSSKSDKIAYTDSLKGAEFIDWLKERIILLERLLSDDGSFYLHIDYKVGHYVKVMLDSVLGINNFRHDITRIKCSPKNFSRRDWGNVKDMILFYSRGDYTWNEVPEPYTEEDLKKLFKKKDANGYYTTVPLHAPGEGKGGKTMEEFRGQKPPKGRHWRVGVDILEQWDFQGLIEWSKTGNPRKKVYANDRVKKGKKRQDIWNFKDPMYPKYPTEKNHEMLEVIVKASSNEGDTVLDCFAGSGSTLLIADRLGRRYIGIDQSDSSIKVINDRLDNFEFLEL